MEARIVQRLRDQAAWARGGHNSGTLCRLLEEAAAIIARLPLTADGVFVPASDYGEFVYFPGDPLPLRVRFSVDSGLWAVRDWGDLPGGEVRHYTSCCYSTPEAAAEAAKGCGGRATPKWR